MQKSLCCSAPIALDGTKERPDCYTCTSCERVIGSDLPERFIAIAVDPMEFEHDPIGEVREHVSEQVTTALDKEAIEFLKRNKLYIEGYNLEQTKSWLANKGLELHLECHPDNRYKYKLLRVVDTLSIKVEQHFKTY